VNNEEFFHLATLLFLVIFNITLCDIFTTGTLQMKLSLSVEVRSSKGSVSFQSQIDATAESLRHFRKELQPGETWSFPFLPIAESNIAIFAAQSMLASTLLINGTETLLEGQSTTDFGVTFARRGYETFGSLPFTGDLSLIQVTNETAKANRIDIIFGEL
jgi:hypothetical protein